MSDYEKVSLNDLPLNDRVDPEQIEARFARVQLGAERSGLTHFRVKPGVRFPFGHRHGEQEETYVLLSGGATLRVGDDALELAPMDAVRVAPAAVRRLEAGPDGAEYLVFGAGRQGDGEKVDGFWEE